ncbi:putative integral membrane protein [Bifidobacterium minimum]|uniref:Putative integral membrane protein n=2 Tax=Bifidobacterium minimum TaxID=1693 RepID=A0A087BT16_9BIFI|nr:putative integral membrane protein [Bifidobacterium minimum]
MTLADSPVSGMPLWIICLIVSVAAFIGDQAGYETGKHSGNIRRIKSWVQGKNRNRIKRAQRFFDDYGSRAIILARFVPILRTFVPFVIGMTHFNHRRFIIANLVGAVIWGVALPSMGYTLGRIPLISNHIEIVCLCIVLISILPLAFKAFTSWLSRSEEIETK